MVQQSAPHLHIVPIRLSTRATPGSVPVSVELSSEPVSSSESVVESEVALSVVPAVLLAVSEPVVPSVSSPEVEFVFPVEELEVPVGIVPEVVVAWVVDVPALPVSVSVMVDPEGVSSSPHAGMIKATPAVNPSINSRLFLGMKATMPDFCS